MSKISPALSRNPHMVAVHALGRSNAPPPQTGWEEPAQGWAGATAGPVAAASPPVSPEVPGRPVGPFAPNVPAAPDVAAPPDGTVTRLTVTWTPPVSDSTHDAASGYTLRYGPAASGTWTTVTGVSSPFVLTGLSGATAMDVQVQAVNAAASPSAWSVSGAGETWGAIVAQGNWAAGASQVRGASVAPAGGVNLTAVAAPTAVTGAAFAWSASGLTVPAAGLIAAGGDGQPNGWGQWFNAPAAAGTYYLWLLARSAGGTVGALVTPAIVVSGSDERDD